MEVAFKIEIFRSPTAKSAFLLSFLWEGFLGYKTVCQVNHPKSKVMVTSEPLIRNDPK